jgi:type IV secretory pathway VirB2 component (pilin)
MSILKIARNAVAASALAMLPAQAIAATSAPVRASATVEDENGQLEGMSGYIVPIVIVVALGIGLYFALQDDDGAVSS